MRLNPTNFKLSHHHWSKRLFDPTSAQDLSEYHDFLLNSRWRDGCPFIVEWPFLTVTEMIKHKIVCQHIEGLISNAK